MAKEIKVHKITSEGLIECLLEEINIGDRFMYNGRECMRIASWEYPPYLKDVPLYVDMDDYTIKFIDNVSDEKKEEVNDEKNDI